MILIKEIEIVKLNKKNTIIVNLINGNADILENILIDKIKNNALYDIPNQIILGLKERGYIFESEEDYENYIEKFNKELVEESMKSAPNFVYIPTYNCNLNCYYCFEHSYEKNIAYTVDLNSNLDGFFSMIDQTRNVLEKRNGTKYKDKDILITLTGGEPLLYENYDVIEELLQVCQKKRYTVAVVTNGTTIEKYIKLFQKYGVKDIQITLDGCKDIHDTIRKYYDGSPSFDKIIRNIGLLNEISKDVSIRINVTRKNIHSVVLLEPLLKQYPNVLFYVYLLQQEGCCDYENVIDELEGLRYLSEIRREHPILLERLRISYHGFKLVNGIFYGKIFSPKVKMCTAMDNQYIVDFTGNIYKCWWGMGNESYTVGNVSQNKESLNITKIDIYKNRSVLNLKKCAKCKYRYICGGGCSGRLTFDDLIKGNTICPDFLNIFQYIIPYEYEINNNGKE